MTAASSVPLLKKSQQAFITYYKSLQDNLNDIRSSQRNRFAEIDKIYQREKDLTEEHQNAKQANKQGDSSRFQNITVPVVMPQVETSVTYQASVFLTGTPLFGVVASPQFMDAAVQLESLIDDQAIRGGWTREFLHFFRDGAKYNFAPLEINWEQEVTASVETDLELSKSEGIAKEVIYSGNKVKRLDPYNTFVDPSVKPTEVHSKGDYAGYTEVMSRIRLKTFIESLPDKIIHNVKAAFESPSNSGGYESRGFYVPEINAEVYDLDDKRSGDTDWLRWAELSSARKNINYKDHYEVTTLYCRVLPSEFELKVPKSNTPQIYKLIIVNHSVIIYCERQTNAHNHIPILIGQPLEDGLGYQTKSLADNGKPFQAVASALTNSMIHSRRRAISDRVLYDPSRILSAHINSENPAAKIPIRPSGYGKPISDSVYPFPYREDQAGLEMQQVQQIMGLANQVSGQNQASQGQFVKGNKTLQEYDDVMQNANGRDQMVSILLESQVLTPLKEILKINILQFQGGTTVYNRDQAQLVEIDPIKLRKAVLEFKVSDGLTPTSKLMNADSFATAIQVIGSSPQIAAGYNIAPLFSYFMKTQGAKITDFEKSAEQTAYEQAVAQWQQVAMNIKDQAIPPQPLPEQFGYDPRVNDPDAQGEANLAPE